MPMTKGRRKERETEIKTERDRREEGEIEQSPRKSRD